MPRHEMVNNVAHKDLRVITRHGEEFGDNVGTVMVVPTEFGDIQREYPIFFRQDPQGEYMSVALLGFAKDENLFLEGDRWDANYVPGIIARGPFLIGFQQRDEGGEVRREPVIHVDMEHPRVSRTEGEPAFLDLGGNSPYLNRIAGILNGINQGIDVSKAMFAAFTAAGLIEPLKVEVKFAEEQYNLVGLQTINREKLANLDAQTLHTLHRSGFLQGAFLVVNSLQNVQRLVDRKQRRIARQAAGQP